jgi:sulfonate transport system permease protein
MTDLAHRQSHTVPSDREQATTPSGEVVPGLIRPVVQQETERTRRVSLLFRILMPLAIFGIWWLITGLGWVAPTVLASPAATWASFVDLLLHKDLIGDIGVSLARAGIGLAIGGGIGLFLGILVGLFRLGEELLDSSLQMFRVIPFPAVIFLFIVWFGIGEGAKVALIALATMFPMYLSTSNGVRNVDRRVVEAARSFGLRGHRLVRQVVIPLSLPPILTGLRYAAGIAIVALVFAETINANQGIGYLANQASSFNQIPVLMVCIFVYALLGILADLMVRTIEKLAMPWRRQMAVR